jgi:hypothetical protein
MSVNHPWSTPTGPSTGAGCGGGCTGAKDAGRDGAVAAKSAAESPAGWDSCPIAREVTGALLLEGSYETVGELSFRARVQWRWSTLWDTCFRGGRSEMISGTCKNVPAHCGWQLQLWCSVW